MQQNGGIVKKVNDESFCLHMVHAHWH